MKTGYAKLTITPEQTVGLAGYDKHRLAEGVMDELYVKAIILDNESEKICLLTYDLIGVDHLLMKKVKNECRTIEADNIVFSATHTHSGPMGSLDTMDEKSPIFNKFNVFGETDEEYLEFLCQRTLEAIDIADSSLEEMQISTLKYEISSIGSNRNDPLLKGDPEVSAVIFEGKSKKAVIFNYACHPTILNSENKRFSADLIGAIAREAENDFDHVIFFNGACGDISTRFNRQGSGEKELDRLGNTFYEEFKKNYPKRVVSDNKMLNISKISIPVRIKKPTELKKAEEVYQDSLKRLEAAKSRNLDRSELRLVEASVEGAKANLDYSKNYRGLEEYPLNCNLVEIADQRFLTYPGEIFSELTNPIKDKFGLGIIGYCDGYSLYMTDETAYEKSYYEAMSSPFEKAEGEKFIAAISNIIEMMIS